MGRLGTNSRPLIAIIQDANKVSICLRNKKKLTDTNVRIHADLTPTQRDEIKKAYKQMEELSERGESHSEKDSKND